jgi:hypothetical protein
MSFGWARRPRYLKGLSISEISSVDRAANPGARVSGPRLTEFYKQILRKREQQEQPDMQTAPVHVQIRKAQELRSSGRIDDYTAAQLEQDLALKMFPDSPSLSHALNKLYNTEIGKRLCKSNVSAAYTDLQKRCATGDGFDVVKRQQDSEHLNADDGEPDLPSENPHAGALQHVVEQFQSRPGPGQKMSFPEAVAHLHRHGSAYEKGVITNFGLCEATKQHLAEVADKKRRGLL